MSFFRRIALVRAHQRIPLVDPLYISDLTELCTLGAVVREHVDWVRIPVMPTDRHPLADFERFVRTERPDLVGVSSFTCGIHSAYEYAEIARRYGAYVVFGGYHPSALPEEVLNDGCVDAVVRGEGEETFAELVRSGPSEVVRGLSWRDGQRLVHNPDRPVILDLDSIPLPAREIRPPRFGLESLDYHTDTIYTSRGCKAKCHFCANALIGKNWRTRSNTNVLQELLGLQATPRGRPKYIKIWDPSTLR